MTLPRQVLAGASYLVTRRCSQREYLMRPDAETTAAYEYCLAVAAARSGVELLFTVAMSNHHHTGIRDPQGRYPEFLEYFHKLFAKCQNALRGRWENFWSSEQTSMVRLTDPEDALDKLVYAVTNPVKDHLVERASEWPGASSLSQNHSGEAKIVKRPKHFFREDGAMPEEVELRFRRPEGFEKLSAKEWSSLLRQRVRRVEMRASGERLQNGVKVLGARAVLAQKWTSRPKTEEPRRGLNPRVAAKNTWRRVEALLRNRLFLKAHRLARQAIDDGYNFALFPEGTYAMTRWFRVLCETAPPLHCLA